MCGFSSLPWWQLMMFAPVSATLSYRHDGGADMVIALVPVGGIERLDRRDQQAEAELELLAGSQAARTAEGADDDRVALFGDRRAALALVAPGRRDAAARRSAMSQVSLRPLELALQAGIEVAEPDHVGRLVDVPCPFPLARADSRPFGRSPSCTWRCRGGRGSPGGCPSGRSPARP